MQAVKQNVINDIKKPMLERLISQSIKEPQLYVGEKTEPYVKKISNLIYEESRYKILDFVENLCVRLCMLAEFQKTKTITLKMALMVLSELPLLYNHLSALEMCDTKINTEYKKKARECLYLDKKVIHNLFIEKGSECVEGIQFDENAMQLLHLSLERFLRTMFYHASYICASKRRRTLYTSDIQMALRIMYPQTNGYVRNPLARIKKIVTFDRDIDAVAKKMYKKPKPFLKNFVDQLNILLNVLSKTVIMVATRLKKEKVRSVNGEDILNAVKYFLPGHLRLHAHSNMKDMKIVVNIDKKTVKKLDHVASMDDETVDKLARLLEYIMAEFIELNGNENDKNITFKTIVENDEELTELLKRLDVYSLTL